MLARASVVRYRAEVMDSMSVTLDEVIAAARARAASLVPETSGYLALAVADASARLPFLVEDPLITLSTEGTVHVKRGSRVADPSDSAFVMRDMLGRLLSLSIGSAPALAGAARTRSASDAVDVFIHELENALVPVNRAAARRALARLARETVRAKEAGRLRRRRRAEPVESARAPAPIVHAPAQQAVAKPSVIAHRAAADAPVPYEPVRLASKDPTPVPVEIDVEEFSATPNPAPLTVSDATTIDTEYADRALLLEPLRHSDVGGPRHSDVDELAKSFTVTTESVDGSHRMWKSLAGMDPTPPPPKASEIAKIVARTIPSASPSEPMMLVVRKANLEERSRADARGRADSPRPEIRSTKPSAAQPAARTLETSRNEADERETRAIRAHRKDIPKPDHDVMLQDSYPEHDLAPPRAHASRWPMFVAVLVGFCIAAGLGHFVPSWLAVADTSREP